jgi:hypothetical protein
MKNSVFVLWLEGVNPDVFSSAPSLVELAKQGVDVQLEPLPLVEQGVCYYQVLTGTGSGKFGRFDAVYPDRYTARKDTGTPEGAVGRLLPDVLRSRKLSVAYLETQDPKALDALADQAYDCALVRLLDMDNADSNALDALIRRCIELASPAAHFMVLTDVWSGSARKVVNINDFLADTGILEASSSRTGTGILWSETLAYGLGTGQVWVNLRGRESQGIVSSGGEYQEVCDALIHELESNWLDPDTGQPVVEQALRKEDVYKGEYLFKAPDLIVKYRPGYAASPKAVALDFDGVSVQRAGDALDAKARVARLVGRGPCLVSGRRETASLVDVMPTIMYLLGQPVPSQVDGNVVSTLFTPAYREQTSETRIDVGEDLLSDEDEGLIVDRLRDLGYLG